MTQIATTPEQQSLTLYDLEVEARFYSQRAVDDIMQLGRVLCKAKAMVAHGQWSAWIQQNAGCSLRTAQQFMAAWQRFGENVYIRGITDKSKLFRMLSLPEGTEDDFAAENDLNEMTTREVEAAVKKVRQEYEAALQEAKCARHTAESELTKLKNREPEVPDGVLETIQTLEAENRSQKEEIDRLSLFGREAMEEANAMRKTNADLTHELAEQGEMLAEVQSSHDRMQQEYLTLQSTIAKGDAERIPADELTLDAFSAAVRQFMGTCARLPHMHKRFARMQAEEREHFDELLLTMENFLVAGRNAINTFAAEGSIDNG